MPNRKVPTALRIAFGTHRKDRHGNAATEVKGVKLKANMPAPARLKTKLEKDTWARLLKILAPKGLATDLDVEAMTSYCEDERLREMLLDEIHKKGIVLKGDRGHKHNQSFGSLDQVRRRQRDFWARFGMSPMDRVGLNVEWDASVAAETSDPVHHRDRS